MKQWPLLFSLLILTCSVSLAQEFQLESPDGKLVVRVKSGKQLEWSASLRTNQNTEQAIIINSAIWLKLATGEILGSNAKPSASSEKKSSTIRALNYKKDSITDNYHQLTLRFKTNYSVVFRAYNEGVAYRFVTDRKDSLIVSEESANFNFNNDYAGFFPYVNDAHNKDVFETSFENNYEHIKLSQFKKDTLAFAPVLLSLPGNIKAAITEADLEDYPGMFLQSTGANGIKGVFAPYPLIEKQNGHNNLQSFVMKRADYIARTSGKRVFPWRVLIVSQQDMDLLNNDMIYKLASPSRIADVSWIKPGKVAWDWWNDWNIKGVDFKAGVNTETYKFYIDFAAANKIENILLDEGWASSLDIMKVVPEIDLKQIVDYGMSKNVGVWLWGGWLPLNKQLDHALSTYAALGIRGFKIDFMDRDDQKMVQFFYRLAKKASEYKLMIDYHGAYKPTGLQRTYPNVMNFEGVRGLENTKWSSTDFPLYDCTIPFIRMLAGPMDYTPGAMKNASKRNYRPINSTPMSQGTRCHQLALYVVYEAPFEMLCDNPNNYMAEPVCTKFLADVPTTFDATVSLAGEIGEYAAIARRKGDTWYAGAITNWTPRSIIINLSFLGKGTFEAEIFQDGVNADRDGTDYKKVTRRVTNADQLTIMLGPGGGWAATFARKKN